MDYVQITENFYWPANWFTEEGLKEMVRFGYTIVKL